MRPHRTRRAAHRTGQVLVLTLLGITLLGALVFVVYNISNQVNHRVEIQNTADAVAVSGAGWMARSMNAVAMNNCGQARMVGLVPVLDALPLAAAMAADEADRWEQALSGQLTRGVPATSGEHLKIGLQSLQQRMALQRDILRAADVAMNDSGFNMETATHWRSRGVGGPAPHGGMWQATVTLDEMSQTTVESSGALAQANAIRFGDLNDAQTSLLVPVRPELPARRGIFDDFRPVLEGIEGVREQHVIFSRTGGKGGAIPDCAIDDSQYRLGPWARLYKWRDASYRHEGGTWVPGTPGPTVRAGQGQVNPGGRSVGGSAIQRGGGSGGHWSGGSSILTGYTTYGPFDWAMRRLHWWANDYWYWSNGRQVRRAGQVPDTFFAAYHSQIARQKLRYMFTDPAIKQLATLHYPQWHVDYAQCRALAADQAVRISQTLFYLVEVVSSVPPTSPQWMSPGTFRTNGEYPISIRSPGWVDPETWNVPKIGDHVWKDSWTYETTYDHEIGLAPEQAPDGTPVYHPVYVVQWYVFGGVDTGGDVEISDPCNWEALEALPAPMLLDTSEGDYVPSTPPEPAAAAHADDGYRRRFFMFLGVARQPLPQAFWPEQFDNPAPGGQMLAVAQAKVFNHSSFDLWTQDWQVRLAPVTGWSGHDSLTWTNRLADGIGTGGDAGRLLDVADLEEVLEYLEALGEAVPEAWSTH